MKIKAIALGVLTDWVATLILAIPIGIIGVVIHLSHGGSVTTFDAFFQGYKPLMLASIFAGSLGTVGGGVVTALVAKEERVWNAFLMGIATSLLSIPFCLSQPLWFLITSFVLMVPCAILGGWIIERRKRGQPSPPPLPQVKKGKMQNVVIALVMLPFLIYFIVIIYVQILGRDILPPNTADLVPERVELTAEQNAFTYFVSATNSLYWPTNTSVVIDYLDGKMGDDALIQETISRNPEMMALLEKGLERQRCLTPEVASFDADISYLTPWRSMGRVWAIKVRHDRLARRYVEATRACISLLRYGDIIQRDAQCEINYLVGLAVLDLGFTQAQDLARDPDIPQEELTRLSEALVNLGPFDHGLIRAIKSEYRAVANMIDQVRDGKVGVGDLFLGMGQKPSSDFSHGRFKSGYMFQPNKTKLIFADVYRGIIKNSSLPYASMTFPDAEKVLDMKGGLFRLMIRPNATGKILFNMMIPAQDSMSERKCRADGSLAATRLIVACNAYQKKEGRLPDDLQSLVPVYLGAIPADPYDGRPFRYSPVKGIIYSVGHDLKDSGGSSNIPDVDKAKHPSKWKWDAEDAVFGIHATTNKVCGEN